MIAVAKGTGGIKARVQEGCRDKLIVFLVFVVILIIVLVIIILLLQKSSAIEIIVQIGVGRIQFGLSTDFGGLGAHIASKDCSMYAKTGQN